MKTLCFEVYLKSVRALVDVVTTSVRASCIQVPEIINVLLVTTLTNVERYCPQFFKPLKPISPVCCYLCGYKNLLLGLRKASHNNPLKILCESPVDWYSSGLFLLLIFTIPYFMLP
jgi:hypothetical protein